MCKYRGTGLTKSKVSHIYNLNGLPIVAIHINKLRVNVKIAIVIPTSL